MTTEELIKLADAISKARAGHATGLLTGVPTLGLSALAANYLTPRALDKELEREGVDVNAIKKRYGKALKLGAGIGAGAGILPLIVALIAGRGKELGVPGVLGLGLGGPAVGAAGGAGLANFIASLAGTFGKYPRKTKKSEAIKLAELLKEAGLPSNVDLPNGEVFDYAFNSKDKKWFHKDLSKRGFPHLVPIGISPFGDVFVKDKRTGKVSLFLHEENRVVPIAENYEAFAKLLNKQGKKVKKSEAIKIAELLKEAAKKKKKGINKALLAAALGLPVAGGLGYGGYRLNKSIEKTIQEAVKNIKL